MSDLTDYHEQLIMDRAFRGVAAPAAPDPLYVALHTGDPSDTGEANEVSAGGYARQSISASNWSGTGSTASNDVEIVFPQATEDWGDISYVSIWNGDESDSGANALWQTALDTSRFIATDDEFRFAAGSLEFEAQ